MFGMKLIINAPLVFYQKGNTIFFLLRMIMSLKLKTWSYGECKVFHPKKEWFHALTMPIDSEIKWKVFLTNIECNQWKITVTRKPLLRYVLCTFSVVRRTNGNFRTNVMFYVPF